MTKHCLTISELVGEVLMSTIVSTLVILKVRIIKYYLCILTLLDFSIKKLKIQNFCLLNNEKYVSQKKFKVTRDNFLKL